MRLNDVHIVSGSVAHLMDCMEGLRTMEDNEYDLAIVDPPYGIDAVKMEMGSSIKNGKRYHSTASKKARFSRGSGKLKNRVLNKSDLDWDTAPPSKEYFKELFRVSKNQIIWGGNYFDLPPTRGVICWDKMQPWENFSQWEMAWTSFDKPAAIVRISNTGGNHGENKIHPTQKPISLYEWCLHKYAKKGDNILDTHLGSQNSRIACYRKGFAFTGFELSPSYFQEGCEHFLNGGKKKTITTEQLKLEYDF